MAQFVIHFLQCHNATQAAIKAGYAKKNASVQGSLLLRNPWVAAELQRRHELIMNEEIVSIYKQQTRLEMIASVTIDQYIDVFDGKAIRFKPIEQWSEAMKMACEGIKYNSKGKVELTLHGKNWAFDQIQKHLGFYEKDNSQKPVVDTGVLIVMPDNKRGKVVPLPADDAEIVE